MKYTVERQRGEGQIANRAWPWLCKMWGTAVGCLHYTLRGVPPQPSPLQKKSFITNSILLGPMQWKKNFQETVFYQSKVKRLWLLVINVPVFVYPTLFFTPSLKYQYCTLDLLIYNVTFWDLGLFWKFWIKGTPYACYDIIKPVIVGKVYSFYLCLVARWACTDDC